MLTLYSPKSHRPAFLRSQAEQLVPELAEAWPRKHRIPRRCFELLRQAYVNARYSPHDEITAEELAWISQQVGILQDLVHKGCERRLALPYHPTLGTDHQHGLTYSCWQNRPLRSSNHL